MQLWLHRAPHAPGIQSGHCSDSLGPCTFDGWACPLRGMSLASFLLSFFPWYKYIDVNVALLGKEGYEPTKEAAKVLTVASHDIHIILFWLELLLQLWVTPSLRT